MKTNEIIRVKREYIAKMKELKALGNDLWALYDEKENLTEIQEIIFEEVDCMDLHFEIALQILTNPKAHL